MEIGAYSFGDPRHPDGSLQPTATAITNILQAIVHADEAGLPAGELGAELVVQLLDFAGRNPF